MRVIKIKSKIRRLHLKELARELADVIFQAELESNGSATVGAGSVLTFFANADSEKMQY